MKRRLLVGGLFTAALVAFVLVKLAPSRAGPRIEVSSGGGEGQLARNVLTTALAKLFAKGNGSWQIEKQPADRSRLDRCGAHSQAVSLATGHAASADYVFAKWLGVRLASYVYARGADAESILTRRDAQQVESCRGQVVSEELRRDGYVVGKPQVSLAAVPIADGAVSARIVIPVRLKGRHYNWDIDSTAVRRGRVTLAVGTVVAEPFAQANQALARELAAAAL